MNKTGRDMERQEGRVKARSGKTSTKAVTLLDNKVGDLVTYWCTNQTCWKTKGVITIKGQVYSKEFYSDDKAEEWVIDKFYELQSVDNKRFGDWLSGELQAWGLNQSKLSDSLRVSRVTISNWCNNHCLPDVTNFVKIGRIFSDVSGQDLNKILEKMAQYV